MRIVKGPGTLTWLFAAVFAIGPVAERTTATAGGDVTLAVPGRSSSTPWIASDGSFVAVAWGARTPAGASDVFVAVSRDAGATFSAPVQVNKTAGEARLGGELPPRVVLSRPGNGEPTVMVLWTARDGGKQTTIRTARSTNGGRSFGDALTIGGAGAPGDRGWQAITADASGQLHAIWLDHRGMAAAEGTHQHAGHGQSATAPEKRDGVAMAQRSGLYYASLDATGRTIRTSERELAKGVCYCCKTALEVRPDGAIVAAWRHVYPGNIRDIAFTMSADSGRSFSAPVRVSEDQWQLDGCPDDGPALVADRDNVVHIVWPTVIGGNTPAGALFYTSTKDGRTFTPRQRIPTLGGPKPSHPQIAIGGDGKLTMAWDEVNNGNRTVAMRSLTPSRTGPPTFGPIHVLGDGVTTYPVLAPTPKGLVAAWTSGNGDRAAITVRTFQ
jgi:hypothetical protein